MSSLRWIYITLKFPSSSCVQKAIINNVTIILGHSEEQALYLYQEHWGTRSLKKSCQPKCCHPAKGMLSQMKKSALTPLQISRENPTCGSFLFLSSGAFFISGLTMRTNKVFLTSSTQWHSFQPLFCVSKYVIFHAKCACRVQNVLFGDVEESGFMSWG